MEGGVPAGLYSHHEECTGVICASDCSAPPLLAWRGGNHSADICGTDIDQCGSQRRPCWRSLGSVLLLRSGVYHSIARSAPGSARGGYTDTCGGAIHTGAYVGTTPLYVDHGACRSSNIGTSLLGSATDSFPFSCRHTASGRRHSQRIAWGCGARNTHGADG